VKTRFLNTKSIYVSAMFGALLIATQAHAASAGGGIVGSPNDRLVLSDTECTSCPNGPEQVREITFENAEALFSTGKVPPPQELSGVWGLILKVKHPELNDVFQSSREGSFVDEEENPDDSGARRLILRSRPSDWNTGFTTTAEIKNLGRRGLNQGPFAVTYRDQSACFAQYGYKNVVSKHVTYQLLPFEGPWKVENATFAYSCRMIGKSNTHLLCAVIPHGEGFDEKQRPWLGRVIEYVGYTKNR
jgi:hypothetical protein